MKIREILAEVDLPPVDDPTFNRLLQRGHVLSHLQQLPQNPYSSGQHYRAYVAPKGGTQYVRRQSWGVPDRREKYGYYDPNLADLQVHDKGEEYLEYMQAHPKEGVVTEIPALGPGFIYRGGSQEEYEFFQQTGRIESAGNSNIGDQQTGLTYWSTDPDQAASYANSFAPNGQKATFEHPAYVWVARAPDPADTRHVEGTGKNEVGVARPIMANEVVQIWRGKIYDYDEGDIGLSPHDYIDQRYRVGSASMPHGRVAWEQIL